MSLFYQNTLVTSGVSPLFSISSICRSSDSSAAISSSSFSVRCSIREHRRSISTSLSYFSSTEAFLRKLSQSSFICLALSAAPEVSPISSRSYITFISERITSQQRFTHIPEKMLTPMRSRSIAPLTLTLVIFQPQVHDFRRSPLLIGDKAVPCRVSCHNEYVVGAHFLLLQQHFHHSPAQLQ